MISSVLYRNSASKCSPVANRNPSLDCGIAPALIAIGCVPWRDTNKTGNHSPEWFPVTGGAKGITNRRNDALWSSLAVGLLSTRLHLHGASAKLSKSTGG